MLNSSRIMFKKTVTLTMDIKYNREMNEPASQRPANKVGHWQKVIVVVVLRVGR